MLCCRFAGCLRLAFACTNVALLDTAIFFERGDVSAHGNLHMLPLRLQFFLCICTLGKYLNWLCVKDSCCLLRTLQTLSVSSSFPQWEPFFMQISDTCMHILFLLCVILCYVYSISHNMCIMCYVIFCTHNIAYDVLMICSLHTFKVFWVLFDAARCCRLAGLGIQCAEYPWEILMTRSNVYVNTRQWDSSDEAQVKCYECAWITKDFSGMTGRVPLDSTLSVFKYRLSRHRLSNEVFFCKGFW